MNAKSCFVIAVLAVSSCSALQGCGVPANGTINYIIGGDDAARHEFPWQVSVQFNVSHDKWDHVCGGSILDKNWILTAAQCVQSNIAGRLRVVLGAYNISNLDAETSTQEINRKTNVVIHPDFDSSLLDYDYALIQLPKPLDFNGAHKHLGPICLPDATDPFMFENMTCIVSGWGLTGFVADLTFPFKPPFDFFLPSDYVPPPPEDMVATVLQKLPLSILLQRNCCLRWGDGRGNSRITDRHICGLTVRGEGTGPCSGDSGSPLQCFVEDRWQLVGAASFIRYCGTSLYPNVFARTTAALDWISKVNSTRIKN